MPTDRRSFLRRAAALGLVGRLSPVAMAWGCGRVEPEHDEDVAPADAPPGPALRPPALLAGPGGSVRVPAPTAEAPVAYLSRGRMRVYVARSYLDWAESKLGAYVSVTTGLWRIRRPEDDPGVPIIPGDALREFEVVDISEWEPGMAPAEGDVRLRLGSPVPVRLDLSCAPLSSGDAWIAAEVVECLRRDGPPGEGGREDFAHVATGSRHPDQACGGRGAPVRILTWTVPVDDPGKG